MKLHFKLRQLLFLGRILIYTKKKVSKLLAWYVQDTWNRPDHVFWRNDKQQNYGRDSNYGKRKSIHILLTFDSFLSPLWLFFGTVFVQKNSRNSMSRHTPIHCILTNNNFRSFPSLNRRNFYWTLQAALEPKPRLIAVLGTKYSRGSHWRNSVRLNQKVTGSTKQRTTSWMKCFNIKRWKLPPKWNLPPRWNLLSPKQLSFQQVPKWELRLFWSDSRRLKAITIPCILYVPLSTTSNSSSVEVFTLIYSWLIKLSLSIMATVPLK